MKKQRTFYEKKTSDLFQSALSRAVEWIEEVNVPFDVTHIDIAMIKQNSWGHYDKCIVKLNFS